MEEAFVLEIPPVPAHVGTARLFVGSIARHFGVDETAVEDAKVGVSEACTSAILLREREDTGEPVRIRIAPLDGHLRFEVLEAVAPEDEDTSASTTDDLIRSLGFELVRSLFPEAETVPGDAAAGLRFAVPMERSGQT